MARDHCFHRLHRYFLEGKEKCQSEANQLAEYPQTCGGGLNSGPPREELIWREDEVSLVVVVAVGVEQQRHHVQKEAVVDCN